MHVTETKESTVSVLSTLSNNQRMRNSCRQSHTVTIPASRWAVLTLQSKDYIVEHPPGIVPPFDDLESQFAKVVDIGPLAEVSEKIEHDY